MDIVRFHQITNDPRPKEVRLLELKENMLVFLNNPSFDVGIDILHLCISITNDYLYCSKPIRVKYIMPIQPDKDTIDRFLFDWNNLFTTEKNDETAYRFYCKDFFELTVRILHFLNINLEDIEQTYVSKIRGFSQLAFL